MLSNNYLHLKLFNIKFLYFSVYSNIFYIKNIYGRIIKFLLPSYFFYNYRLRNVDIMQVKFMFLKRFFYSSFLAHFFYHYIQLFSVFFVKLKIRGLGYRMRKVSSFLYLFFFNYTNYYYFFRPFDLLIKIYRKRMLLLACSGFCLG